MSGDPGESQRKSYESGGELPGLGRYETVAGWLALRDGPRESERAEVFYIYYRADVGGESRPLMFVFNGGPGASSAYLHMGAAGPRRVFTENDGSIPPAPARVVDNEECWLPHTDLVFIDPVGTGLSRTVESAAKDGDTETKKLDTHYWNVESDLDSLASFFEGFLSKHRRWGSPIFIAGESYGGYRAARLLRRAPEKAGVGVSGAFLISPALEWEFLYGGPFGALYYATLMPAMAAAAHALGRAGDGRSFDDHRARAEAFALRELLPAVASACFEGDGFTKEDAAKLADTIGLSPELCHERGGRIDMQTFVRELLRDEGRILGLYDASLAAQDPLPQRPTFEGMDPSLAAQNHLFTTAANRHLRQDLGIDDERRYHLLNFEVNEKWTFEDHSHDFHLLPAGASKDVAVALAGNPAMQVVICHGYFDLVTPYFVSDYIVGSLGRTSPAAHRIHSQHFRGGHMFYTHQASRRGLVDLVGQTIDRATSGT